MVPYGPANLDGIANGETAASFETATANARNYENAKVAGVMAIECSEALGIRILPFGAAATNVFTFEVRTWKRIERLAARNYGGDSGEYDLTTGGSAYAVSSIKRFTCKLGSISSPLTSSADDMSICDAEFFAEEIRAIHGNATEYSITSPATDDATLQEAGVVIADVTVSTRCDDFVTIQAKCEGEGDFSAGNAASELNFIVSLV